MADHEVDVLVVGAGPVGLTAAVGLVDRGVRVLLIDALAAPSTQTKSSITHHRTLELLPAHVVDEQQAASCLLRGLSLYESLRADREERGDSRVKLVLAVDAQGHSDFAGEGLWAQQQWKTEQNLSKYLNRKLDETGQMHALRSTRLVSAKHAQDGASVLVTIETDGVLSTVRCKFLIGCDGAHSTVRKTLNIRFDGETMSEGFLALHASFSGVAREMTERGVIIFSDGDGDEAGFVFSIPQPNDPPYSALVIIDLSPKQCESFYNGQRDKHGNHLMREITPEEVIDIARCRGFGSPTTTILPNSVQWCTSFRVSSRMAEHYRSGRIFLCGDACHCHSPLGGQGMNMGMQDATNLCWKLAMAIKGQLVDPEPLLNTYEEERRGVDARILSAIERAAHISSSRSPFLYWARGRAQRLIARLTAIHGPLVRTLSQQVHSYAGCSGVSEHWERPPPIPVPASRIFPFGGYRRRQNLFRWLSPRVRAGDRTPNLTLPPPITADHANGKPLEQHSLYPYALGWVVLFFEGSPEENQSQEIHLRDVIVRPVVQLTLAARELLQAAPILNCAFVFPSSDTAAAEAMGVRGQCLFLIRPDSHVALRVEPCREAAVLRFMIKTIRAAGVIPAYISHSMSAADSCASERGKLKTSNTMKLPYASPNFDFVPLIGIAITIACTAAAVGVFRAALRG